MEASTTLYPQKSTNVRSIDPLERARRVLHAVDEVAPAVAVRVAERLFTHPRRHARRSEELEVIARAEERLSIPHAGGALRAWAWGEGRTILLVHGWEGRGSQLGAFVPPLVGAGFRVVAFDAPAHGNTRGSSATLVDFTAAVSDVVREVGPVAGVVAHSLGAAATTVALARGARIGRVVYLAPMFDVRGIVRDFAQRAGLGARSVDRFQERIETRTRTPIAALEGSDHARTFHLPALVVHDPDDREVPFTHAEGLLSSWRNAKLVRAPGLGHRRIVRDPATVAAAVEFLRAGLPARLAPEALVTWELFHRDDR